MPFTSLGYSLGTRTSRSQPLTRSCMTCCRLCAKIKCGNEKCVKCVNLELPLKPILTFRPQKKKSKKKRVMMNGLYVCWREAKCTVNTDFQPYFPRRFHNTTPFSLLHPSRLIIVDRWNSFASELKQGPSNLVFLIISYPFLLPRLSPKTEPGESQERNPPPTPCLTERISH